LNGEATVDMTHTVLRFRDPTQALRIINMSSLGAFYPMPTKAVYAASKRFLLDFSQALNFELRDENVNVCVVCPAGLPTYREAIQRLLAQGLAGQLTTLNVGEVAQGAIDCALAGKAVYVPGAINRLLASLGRLLPPAWVVNIIGRRWMKTNS
jgi:short-subunit dehydrogenase